MVNEDKAVLGNLFRALCKSSLRHPSTVFCCRAHQGRSFDTTCIWIWGLLAKGTFTRHKTLNNTLQSEAKHISRGF